MAIIRMGVTNKNKHSIADHSADSFTEDEDRRALKLPVTKTLENYYAKYTDLKGIPADTIKRAWFTMSHLLLEPGAFVIDMGCSDGAMTFVMATLHPEITFLGVDGNSKKITKARNKFVLPNLKFKTADITKDSTFEKNSADAIINSFILHEVYSSARYRDKPVVELLENQFSYLKDEGYMFIHGYSMPPPEKYVLMEMPDTQSSSEALQDLSEPDLLVWFSEHARPSEDVGCHGFFLEELPARFPKTRLFRLPYRWAYEFIIRKDNRKDWDEELPKQYTFFTPREFRKNLRGLGARVQYTAPCWSESKIRECFEGRFRLIDDDGTQLGSPPTSFITVAQKIPNGQSVLIQERRPSNGQTERRLEITSMRNEVSGKIHEIVSRGMELTDILPYRVASNGDLYVYVQQSVPRGISNAIPRKGLSLDGKRWSGHMTEAISLPTEIVMESETGQYKDSVKFARDYLGLKPFIEALLQKGPSFFPAPDFIDERIHTRYLNVTEPTDKITPRISSVETHGFLNNSKIREIKAQHLLNAISVGLIPNSNLEVQILNLFQMLDKKAESWNDSPLTLDVDTPEHLFDGKELMRLIGEADSRFKKTKGSVGQIRSIQSVFVDEGVVEGSIKGMRSSDLEFVLNGEQTHNKAVVLPLTRDAQSEEVMAGVITEHLPVPQRYQGTGATISAPSFSLPAEVTTIEEAKKFVADQFGVTVDKVSRLGESYYCHIGVTPTRIFPFAVASTNQPSTPFGGPVTFAPLKYIYYLTCVYALEYNYAFDVSWFMYAATRNLMYDSDMSRSLADGYNMHHGRDHKSTIETGLNMSGLMGNKEYSATTTSSGSGSSGGGGSSSGGYQPSAQTSTASVDNGSSSGGGGSGKKRKAESTPMFAPQAPAVDGAVAQTQAPAPQMPAKKAASDTATTEAATPQNTTTGETAAAETSSPITEAQIVDTSLPPAESVSFHSSSPDAADINIDVSNDTYSAFSKKRAKKKKNDKDNNKDYDAA